MNNGKYVIYGKHKSHKSHSFWGLTPTPAPKIAGKEIFPSLSKKTCHYGNLTYVLGVGIAAHLATRESWNSRCKTRG